jgi:hypothetical protein
MRAIALILLTAAALAAAGCDNKDNIKVSSAPLASTTVAASAGGQVEINTGPFVGTSVNIPANALAADTKVTIATAAQGTLATYSRVGQTFAFGPDGTTFSSPVTVQLKYDSATLPSGTTANDVVMVHLPAGGTATVVSGSGTGGNPNYVSGQVSSFSRFWAAVLTPIPAVPTITGILPAQGSTAGTTAVLITGSNFSTTGTTTVTFGGVPATNVNVPTAATIACVAPAHAAGVVDVVVTTGGQTATLAGGFTYAAMATVTVTGVAPATGSTAGGTALTLTGTGFSTGSGTPGVTVNVAFNIALATNVQVVSDTSITCTSPAGTAGTVTVGVAINNGATVLGAGGLPNAFTYTAGGGGGGSGSWTATSTTGGPSARSNVGVAQASGTVYVWGGADNNGNFFGDGFAYNQSTDAWTTMGTTGAPSARSYFQMVTVGTKIYVWGGVNSIGNATGGGVYDTANSTWSAMNTTGAVDAPAHTDGTDIFAFGGWGAGGGAKYTVATDTWSALPTANAPSNRGNHFSGIAAGYFLVWGGYDTVANATVNTGGKYHIATDTWSAISTTGAPSARQEGAGAPTTNSKFLVWGGAPPTGAELGTGGVYDPAADTWSATSTTNAPSARSHCIAVLGGSGVAVWGGATFGGTTVTHDTGALYDAATDTWTTMTTTGAPSGRTHHGGVYVGKYIFFGGSDGTNVLNTGGVFTP